MRSKFFFKSHPKHSSDHERSIEADYVSFEDSWVVFYKSGIMSYPSLEETQPHFIIKALHREVVHDLREVINDGDS